MLGVNIAMGQMVSSPPVSQWIGWVNELYVNQSVPLKYFWRDADQVAAQYHEWGDKTSAVLAVQNEELPLSSDHSFAILEPFRKWTIVRAYAVGNEMDASHDPDAFSNQVLSSMDVLYDTAQKLHMPVMISTPLTMRMFGWEAMTVDPAWTPVLHRLLKFLDRTGSPFMVNFYPYLSWYNHQELYTFEQAMTTLLPQKIKWLRNFLDSLGYPNVSIWVTETGWPTEGNPATTIENAQSYLHHARNVAAQWQIPIYWFELVDEILKPGSEDEHHYGLFTTDGRYKFGETF